MALSDVDVQKQASKQKHKTLIYKYPTLALQQETLLLNKVLIIMLFSIICIDQAYDGFH